ncbi:MAG TPA: SPFH domain-containing protein [Tepidisphaeraceae bacterium]|jgi:hypothetical protein
MPPAPPLFAQRRDGRVVARPEPTTLKFTLPDLRTADGHAVTAYVTATARLVDRPADVQLFTEHFLHGRDDATADDLKQHFASPLAASAREFVARHDADACLRQQTTLETLLLQRCEAIAFGCGLEFLKPLTVVLDSETLRADQQRRTARKRQLDDAEHAVKLSETLASVDASTRLPIAEQAALLPTLLAALPRTRVVLTAGPNVVTIDPDDTLNVIPAPAAVGPLRSIRSLGDGRYAVGGTNGVAVLDGAFAVSELFTGGSTSSRGFNAVAWLNTKDELAATHGEFGLVVWSTDRKNTPRTLPTSAAARLLMPLDDRLIFAAGGSVQVYDGRTVETIDGSDGASIIAFARLHDGVAVFRADGRVQTLDRATLQRISQTQLTPDAVAAIGLPLRGMQAAVIASGRGGFDCLSLDGSPLARAPGPPLRMLAMAGGCPVAVTADRTGVKIWDVLTQPEPRTINVLARTGHHVTDLIAD